MTYFLGNGNTFTVAADESLDIRTELPAGNYTVKWDEFNKRYFFVMVDSFELPSKLYGNTNFMTGRILNTFAARPAQTGVMLCGEKGSGKTLQVKALSVEAARKGIPTVVINEPWCGEEFNSFVQSIDQPIIIVFDEFEKVYDSDDQKKLLTLLDGVYPSKKLFVMTTNDKWAVDRHMSNRPGRIFYRLDYTGLDREFIEEYCRDNLKDKSHIPAVISASVMFAQFNFDLLKALVEEMNRYKEAPKEALRVLNATPEVDDDSIFDVSLQRDDHELKSEWLFDNTWEGNPFEDGVYVNYYTEDVTWNPKKDPERRRGSARAYFQASDFQKSDQYGILYFANEKGYKLALARRRPSNFSYFA